MHRKITTILELNQKRIFRAFIKNLIDRIVGYSISIEFIADPTILNDLEKFPIADGRFNFLKISKFSKNLNKLQ